MPSFAKRLSAARNAVGLSQSDLAEAVNAAQSTVATWERGKNEPDLKTITRIARAVHKPPEWLAFAVSDTAQDLALVPELDARAPSGPGGLMEVGAWDGEQVLRRYGFPRSEFRQILGASPEGVAVLEVRGDSMFPTLMPGEKVFVDTTDKTPSPPGIFVVWDGMGLVMKRVEFVPQSDPPTVRIMSDNGRYDAYSRTIDEAYIQGRVIGSLTRR
jgi:phage repressor protein C with HTH and peptisase S24 domain